MNRLDRDEPRPDAVAEALGYWRWLSRASPHDLQRAFGDSHESWARDKDVARDTLQRALYALPRQARRELVAVVEPLDARILARTSPDYHVPDYYMPDMAHWWKRRVGHRR